MKTLLNILISMGWVYLFERQGWVTIHSDSDRLGALLIIAVVALIVELVITWVYTAATCLTFGLGCIFYPIVMIAMGWLALSGTASLTNLLTINVPFQWTGLVMSVAFGLIRFPSASVSRTSSSNE